ncbi:DMT family transporter [Glacieibacterium frigidum]|uniref:DMT family transporter n=1 Tax=Glacieibacterium frigidum TaxID=2593303 RepID=A0A552U861_9SPHN|nr:DMT family transporter [Glacieibacterium frigidum]TRW14391.1 DMT family transporter [Glacieibacterium frigidum]
MTPATRAILWMILSCAAFAALWTCIRIASADLHPFAIVVARNLFGLMWLTPMLLANPGLLRRDRLPIHLRRAASGVIATFATFYAVAHLPLSTALAINYTAPLFATIGAVFFLGERIAWRRMAALAVGFTGMLIVLHPGTTPFSAGLLAALVSALTTAFSIIAIKKLVGADDARAVAAWSFVLTLGPSLVIAAPFASVPPAHVWPILVLLGGCAALGQYALAQAFRHAEASAIMPYDFVRFGLITVAGIALFGEAVDARTLIGGAVIVSATIYLAIRESVVARSLKPSASPDT